MNFNIEFQKILMKRLLKKLLLRRLRWILRGHRTLKTEGSEAKIYAAIQAVATAEFLKNKVYSKLIFGAAVEKAELAIRQYLLARTVVGFRFSKPLLYALGKPKGWVTHPLPHEWRKVVRKYGFKLPRIWSAAVWNGFVIFLFLRGILSIGKKIWGSVKALIHPSLSMPNRFVFFNGLTAGNIPHSQENGPSYDIVSWYWQWSDRVKKIDALCHDVKGVDTCKINGVPVMTVSSAILPLMKLGALLRYIRWSFAAIFLAMIDLLRGRWWHALLLEEGSLAAIIRLQSHQNMAQDYLFHNSNWTYRPLWTYEAAQKGSRITFYFYSSAGGDGFKRANGDYPPPYFGYSMMNWPHYLVWDNHQANAIRLLVGERVNVSVVGPIWFHSSGIKLPALSSKAIAVFDVQPVRDSFYQSFGIDFDYYTPTTTIQFLSDIDMALARSNYQFILKRKRHIGRLLHPKYKHFIKKLTERCDFVNIDPDISAIQLIKECAAVISMPFTSTAIIAKELGKPSVYYDPHGLIQKDDRGAHGIDILCGPEELSAWIATIDNVETMNETLCS